MKEHRGTATRSPKDWAEIIAGNLTGEQIESFVDCLDSNFDAFFTALQAIDAKRNRGIYRK